VRAEFNALRAQGANASTERLVALVDELEALSASGMDPRYFVALRKLLQINARVQALNTELTAILKAPTPAGEVRRKQILDEMTALGQEVNTHAQQVQKYAAPLTNGLQKP
jgi:hypothetical protein